MSGRAERGFSAEWPVPVRARLRAARLIAAIEHLEQARSSSSGMGSQSFSTSADDCGCSSAERTRARFPANTWRRSPAGSRRHAAAAFRRRGYARCPQYRRSGGVFRTAAHTRSVHRAPARSRLMRFCGFQLIRAVQTGVSSISRTRPFIRSVSCSIAAR